MNYFEIFGNNEAQYSTATITGRHIYVQLPGLLNLNYYKQAWKHRRHALPLYIYLSSSNMYNIRTCGPNMS
jgi:hypothetical protein